MRKFSRKSGFKLWWLISSMSIFWLSSCDPCRDVAEKICDCREDSEEKKRLCKANLSLAKSYKDFDKAHDPKICEEVLKHCSCEDLLKDDDQQCGFYRNSVPK